MVQKLLLLFLLLRSLAVFSQEISHNHSVYHAFLENKGQWNENILFKSKFHGGNLWVQQGKILFHFQDYSLVEESHAFKSKKQLPENLTFQQELVHQEFLKANFVDKVNKYGKTSHYFNFFKGKDKQRWKNEVYGYESFVLTDFYDGIDLRYIEKEHQLKYEFEVKPGANPENIKWVYANHRSLKVNRAGELVISAKLGEIKEEKPYAYQIINGKIIPVDCKFVASKDTVFFELGEYNTDIKLVIDPTLVFSTFNGAVSDNFGMTATYGYDGSAYTAGMVYGNDYPMPDTDAFDINSNFTVPNVGVVTTDAFLSKFSDDGTTMIWSTFFGGGSNTQGTEVPQSLICDINNNIYVYGVTSALDFPIVNGFQANHAGGIPFSINFNGTNFGTVGTDIFVAKFSANGHDLLGSTYVGGSGNDGVNYNLSAGNYNSAAAYDSLSTNYGDQFRGEIMLDENENIIVASCSRSTDFPVFQAFQATNAGQQDGVVFKIESDFSSLLFSSYFGGSNNDACYSVKLDESENIFIAGGTVSPDLPAVSGAYQASFQGGKADGFIAKISSNGLNLLQTTYVGTSNYDQVFFVEVDRNNEVFVVGQSNGGNFPVSIGAYSNPNSSQFIAKLDTDLTQIIGSTVFGSGNPVFDISPSAFLVDVCGNMYVSGWGANILSSAPMQPMPVSPNAFLPNSPNGFDFYLIVIERDFGGLLYGTYMGGPISTEHVDGGTSRFDKNGVVYQAVCAGCGGNSDFPTTSDAWSNQNLANNCNALVFKFDFNLIPTADFTASETSGCAPFEVAFENNSSQSDAFLWDFGNGNLDSTTFEPVITYNSPGTYEVFLYVTDSVCLITDTAVVTIVVEPELLLDELNDFAQCEPSELTLTANSFGSAETFIWSSNIDFTDTLNNSPQDSVLVFIPPNSGYYYILIENGACSKVDSVLISFTSSSLELIGDTELCLGDEVNIFANSLDQNLQFNDFVWSPSSSLIAGQGSNEVTVSPEQTGYLYVTATASNGCVVSDSILMQVSDIEDSLVSAIASEYEVPVGATVTLTAFPLGYDYTWIPGGLLTDVNGQQTDALINENTVFTAFVSDGICTKTAQVEVKVFIYRCEEPYIFVPNAFTPNNDGNNDVLFVKSVVINQDDEFIFRIYNRWGEKVFETNDIQEGWDGTWKGKLQAPDVYDYYLQGYCLGGDEFLMQGNITLLR